MGPFEAGTEVEIRFTIQPSNGSTYTGSNEYLMVRKESGFNFYYLDEEAFTEDINKLKQNEWVLDTEKSNDRYLVGDVDAQEGQILMTSIPYEPGWKVQVDGKTVDSLVVNQKNADGTTTFSNAEGDTGEIIVLNALIGIKLPAGHHTVSMKYTPPGFNAGVFTLILGIAVIVLLYIYDSKHNKILIERRRDRELIKKAKDDPEAVKAEIEAAEKAKKDVKIIKSKGEVARKIPDEPEKKDEGSEKPKSEDEKANELAQKAEENIKALEKEAAAEQDKEAEVSEEETAPKNEKTPEPQNAPKQKNGGKKKKKK